ncbi:MAG: hypothetical protein IPL32_18940 [Chloracidobacterium sp.]|nr:hypothetical protein [Chloracidobacterium sp.]
MASKTADAIAARAASAETAAAAAIALAEKAARTADALASAKAATDTASALLAADLVRIKNDLAEIKTALQSGYVTQERFRAVEADISANLKLAELHAARITALENSKFENVGKGDGMRAMWGWIVAVISLVIMVGGFLIQNLRLK